jgi:hypothetical protein
VWCHKNFSCSPGNWNKHSVWSAVQTNKHPDISQRINCHTCLATSYVYSR